MNLLAISLFFAIFFSGYLAEEAALLPSYFVGHVHDSLVHLDAGRRLDRTRRDEVLYVRLVDGDALPRRLVASREARAGLPLRGVEAADALLPQGAAAVTARAFRGATPTEDNGFKLPLATRALASVIAQAKA